MTCETCKNEFLHDGVPANMQTGSIQRCPQCPDARPPVESRDFYVMEKVHFKEYKRNGGNVSRHRVEMIKSRCLAPHGKGEVVMKTKFGKITDKQAVPF